MTVVWAVVVCGGKGERMGGSVNKTLLPVAGVPCVARVVRAFRSCGVAVALVVQPVEKAVFEETLARFGERADLYADAGFDRQESVYHGLLALPCDAEIALVHDGARGLLTKDLILRVIDSVRMYGSGVAALPVTDTVKRADDGEYVEETVDRSALRAVQTPQGFRFRELLNAHETAARAADGCNSLATEEARLLTTAQAARAADGCNSLATEETHFCTAKASPCVMEAPRATDDAALMEALGYRVRLVAGEKRNIKLTTPEDIRMAEALIGKMTRTGIGFDAHRLVEGRRLVLGGVDIPFEKGLLGHSDADVALHALMDAMLGASALGDIGKCFPDTDDAYRGISSLILLEKTDELLKNHGVFVDSVDLTIVAQRPKLAPFIDSMRQRIADALQVSVDSVSVKATTTENMGFEGRGEGISAQAVAVVHQFIDAP